jgi:predicted GTPase
MFLPAGRLPVVLLSARHNQGTAELLDAVVDAYSKWNRK